MDADGGNLLIQAEVSQASCVGGREMVGGGESLEKQNP